MSWLYSQGLVAESSVDTSLDGAPCALWSVTPTPQASWLPAKTTDACRLSRSGMTFKPLTDAHGEAVLTWCLEASPVKTSAQPERALESTASAAACGHTWHESLARFDRDTHLWRTPQCLLLAGLDEFSETWPRWGMMRDGECFPQRRLVPNTSGSDYSYLPTPTSHNAKEGNYPAEHTRRTPSLATHAGGKINPEWTEWLMGWPIRWTDLKPLATDKFQEWLHSHLTY
jgi:hypothetical protein